MVKPDVKHNYYADLDLPTNASIEDVRKAYRKLALQFHPDRNAGKEAECVPRFQAIQAANEVLCDATTKARYDADRRKVGLYPSTTYKPNVPSPGNPYAASSAFPPPPRRTQPGQSTYQRSGADRFTNFPRAANTAPRKDPASERTEQFRAWQSMNTGTQRPAPPPRPAASPKPPTPNGRPGMPRQDTKLPSEEQIRAGMRHGKAPTSSAETLNARQTAWQEYGKNGPTRAKNQRPVPATPKRAGGFDPNAPGSDERAAPQSSHYSRRDRSDDFGYPPPPPGPPPASGPQSPVSPETPRPYADPLRTFRQRNHDEDAPYMEGNRTSTPYSSVSGEKTQFSSEGLRRSASTRDTTNIHSESPTSSNRARSTSPLGRQQKQTNGKQTRTPRPASFQPGMESSSSDPSSDDVEPAPRERKIAQPKPRRDRFPNHEPSSPFQRPTPDVPPTPDAQPTTAAQPDTDQPDMQQRKSSTNMYARPSLSSTSRSSTSSFSRKKWFGENFGYGETSVPRWAVPSSILPASGRRKLRRSIPEVTCASNELLQEVEQDPLWCGSSTDQRRAYLFFRTESIAARGAELAPSHVKMADLWILLQLVSDGRSTEVPFFDRLFSEILERFPSVAPNDVHHPPADRTSSANRFSIPINHDTFTPTSAKSRSEETINTNFSPEGWSGKFAGSTDYFAPETSGTRRSPARRTGSRRGLYTPDSGSASASASESMPPPPPPDSTRPVPQPPPDSTRPVPLNGKFSEEEWKSTFKDASWTWPPPPSTAPPADTKPGLRSKAGSRKASKLSSKPSHLSSASSTNSQATAGTRESPVVVDDDDALPEAEPDAMDIDTPPPTRPVPDTTEQATPTQPTSNAKGARVYSVPISEWRQQQAEAIRELPTAKRQARTTTTEPHFKTNLDDLANVEPIARSVDGGLKNLADLSSTLPFTSQPSTSTMSGKEAQPLQIPALPKVPTAPNKWTKSSWHDYAQRFAAYLQHHHQFKRTVLAHFEAREKLAEERMRDSGWLEQTGDGFEVYARDVKSDEKVREVWNLAEERHGEAVKGFEGTREQIRRIVGGGGLVD